MTAETFYLERDRRSLEYGLEDVGAATPVFVRVGPGGHCSDGQTAALAVTNMLVRFHRRVRILVPRSPLLVPVGTGGATLAEALDRLARSADPHVDVDVSEDLVDVSGLTVEVGPHAAAVTWGRWWAELHTGRGSVASPAHVGGRIGAGAAACLLASAAVRFAHRLPVHPHVVSLLDLGPTRGEGVPIPEVLDVGDVLVIGAGGVGASFAWWASLGPTIGRWVVVDGDAVEISNLNRTLGLFAADAGATGTDPRAKAVVVAELLGGEPVTTWYDQWDYGADRFDLVLPLANERGVRAAMPSRGDSLQLHASTSSNWTAELHRHRAGTDDCMACRFRDAPVAFKCGHATLGPSGGDAALAFLSAGAGLLLLGQLFRVQLGLVDSGAHNHWRWNLGLGAGPSMGRSVHRCRQGCQAVLPEPVRSRLNAGSRWEVPGIG